MNWVLSIDLRERGNELRLLLTLARLPDRRWQRRIVWPAELGEVRGLGELLRACFGAEGQRVRKDGMIRFGDLAGSILGINALWTESALANDDTLTIETTVTSIPWDLVRFRGEFLGHQIATGVSVPTPTRAFPHGRGGEGRPRFLHIVADPLADLSAAHHEQLALSGLVAKFRPDLQYELLRDPDSFKLHQSLIDKRATPFVHFTGHLDPAEGLMLARRSFFSHDRIVDCFPGSQEQVVFLNGCDSVLDAPAQREHVDMFQPASVANAFLYAGARAVVAPRSKIPDEDALLAARTIWEAILRGERLGDAVRRVRDDAVRRTPDHVVGYTYVLYGPPDFRASGSTTASPTGDETAIARAILDEAAIDAGGALTPRHIFGALTRRWLVGSRYFELEGQSYIAWLVELRRHLDIPEHAALVPGTTPPPAGVPTTGGQVVIQRARLLAAGNPLEDHHLLRAVAEIGDAEVTGAMSQLERGPRTLDELVASARDWVDRGRPAARALILPDGTVDRATFLPEIPARASDGTDAVDCWDLFAGLVAGGVVTPSLWRGPALPRGRWLAGAPLDWSTLDQNAILLILRVADRRPDDRSPVSERDLLRELSVSPELAWDRLDSATRDALVAAGWDDHRWRHECQMVALKSHLR